MQHSSSACAPCVQALDIHSRATGVAISAFAQLPVRSPSAWLHIVRQQLDEPTEAWDWDEDGGARLGRGELTELHIAPMLQQGRIRRHGECPAAVPNLQIHNHLMACLLAGSRVSTPLYEDQCLKLLTHIVLFQVYVEHFGLHLRAQAAVYQQ